MQDPRSVVDAALASREAADPIVTALTHRKLHPPPKPAEPAKPAQSRGEGHARAGERGGSRLGGPVAPGPAPTAGAGAATAAAAGAAATPAGALPVCPSEQSLGGLLGTAGPDSSLPADMELGDAAGVAAAAAALAAQTVERRRLNLEALDSPAGVLTTAGMRRQQQLAVSSSGEEEENSEAAAAAAAAGGAGSAGDEPSSAPPSSMMVAGDSQALGLRHGEGSGGGGRASGGLTYAASVDLINAPISEMESEQAEMLNADTAAP